MTMKNISGDYAQVALCVLDAVTDMIEFGVPKKAVDLHSTLASSLDIARANLEHIPRANSLAEFSKRMFHIKGQLLLVSNTLMAEARPSVAIAVKHYTQAVLDLLQEQQPDFYEPESSFQVNF